MAIGLRPFVQIPTTLREWTRWCREAILDLTISASNIEDGSITLAKHADVATDTLLGRSAVGTGPVQTITCTAAGRALLDDAAASNQRTTLGLGTAAVQNTGTSGANVPLLNGANVHASAQCTLFGMGSATPVGSQAAQADTSGATLGQLETELNSIKAKLRTVGIMLT
jgi:hypothetical protein